MTGVVGSIRAGGQTGIRPWRCQFWQRTGDAGAAQRGQRYLFKLRLTKGVETGRLQPPWAGRTARTQVPVGPARMDQEVPSATRSVPLLSWVRPGFRYARMLTHLS
jgi:hypothetical protein